MFNDTVLISSQLIKPAIDASCKVNGLLCNIYYKRQIENVTQITGRGSYGTNEGSFYHLPDFCKKPLLLSDQTKVGYKGSKGKNNPKGIETLDSVSENPAQTHIITYDKQYGIEWKENMKIEVFYNRNSTYPSVTYQTTKVLEMALPNNSTIHSGLIHVYLVPFM